MAINKNKVMDAARKAVEKGQFDKAIKEYLKVVKEDPKDVRVWLKIGDLYAKLGSKQDATDTYLKVAKFYSEQGFYLKAVAVYKQILKLDPRLVEVNLKLAELYRQLGLLSDAMQHFEMVAAFFHREGKTKEALATIRQLVDLDPENVATRIKLAELYSKEGMVDEASAEFGHACDYLRKHNRQDDFIKVAERLLWHKAENIALSRELAGLYLRRNDARRALQKLQVCFKADPRDVETLALLAQAFQALDQKGKTVSVLKELARILSENGQRGQAEDVHRKILMYVPDDPDSLAFLGKTASRQESSEDEIDLSQADVIEVPMTPPRRTGFGAPTGSMPLVNPSDIPDYGGEPLMEDPLAGFDRAASYGDAYDPSSSPAFMAELSLDDESSFDGDSSVGGEVHSDEIVKILTETDVYVKYALHQKAIEHLRRVFELDAENVEARLRLKEILLSQGREDEAIRELLKLAEHAAGHDPERAEAYLREVLTLDGSRREVFSLADRYRLNLSGGPEVEVVDDLSDAAIEVDIERGASGAVAEVAELEDELEFDDLDFDRGAQGFDLIENRAPHAPAQDRAVGSGAASFDRPGSYNQAESDVEFHARAPGAYERSAVPKPASPAYDSQQFDDAFAEFDDPDSQVTPDDIEPELSTMEVDLDQVEEAVSIAELESEELDFNAPVETDVPDMPLDIEDAKAFDASLPGVPNPGLTDENADALDAEPIGFEGEFEIPDSREVRRPLSSIPPIPPILPVPHGAGARGPTASPHDPTHQLALPEGPTTEEQDLGDELRSALGPSSLEDDLDEADFFVTQNLMTEARDILEGLLARYPNHPLVMAKLRDVDAMLETHEGVEVTPDLSPAPEQSPGHTIDGAGVPRPQVMLEKPVDDEDADTHYDLGLAYKEMGLHDEAIKAFHKVLNVAGREVQCHLMIGLCYREQGNLSEAINQFKAGLYVDSISSAEKFDLYYEIGNCYESLNDPQEALYYYEMVLKKDAKYRDVAARVSAIRGGTGGATNTHPEV